MRVSRGQNGGAEKISISTQRRRGLRRFARFRACIEGAKCAPAVIKCAHVSRRRRLLLARIQFGFTVSFHFIFPAFSIGLASYLAVLEALWLKTGKAVYLDLYKYWLKIFAVVFAMGVVSGIVMAYQFGTNWAVFSDRAGPVIGPLMAYEVLTAFFLEAGFLGVMLFGMKKVGKRPALLRHAHGGDRHLHLRVLDPERQQLDADAHGLRHQRARAVRARGRLAADHLQSELSVSPGAHRHRRVPDHRARRGRGGRVAPAARLEAASTRARCFPWPCGWRRWSRRCRYSSAISMASTRSSISRRRSWPWKGTTRATPQGAPLILFGIPDDEAQRMEHAIEIPRLGSLILKHDLDAPLAGLDTIAPQNRPPVEVVFWSFRVMVGLGTAHARARRVEPARARRAASCTTGAG